MKVKTTTKHLQYTATVIMRNKDGKLVEFVDFQDVSTRSIREAKQLMAEAYEDFGTVIAITDGKFETIRTHEVYTVNATNEDVLAACRAYGLEVVGEDSEN